MQFLLWFLIFWCGILMAFSKVDVTKHPNWTLLDHAKCGNSNSDRIVGGRNASLGAYPWIARLGYKISKDDELFYACGGSLINKLYILTAAHCVKNFKVAGIRLGEHYTLTDPDCEHGYCAEPVQDFSPASIIIHENYYNSFYKMRNDIAIIRLNKPANYNEYVRPICMMDNHLLMKDFSGEIAEVAGWGKYDNNNSKLSVILQTINVPILNMSRCKRFYNQYADDKQQLCAGGIAGEDSCSGDSGGPLMKVEGTPPRYYLIGIVSFGMKYCGIPEIPAVYSKISEHIIWILNNISP